MSFRLASCVPGVLVYPLLALFVVAPAGLITDNWLPGRRGQGDLCVLFCYWV